MADERILTTTSVGDTALAPMLRLQDLKETIRSVDPAVVLVKPRILRRVIKHHARVGGLAVRVPHRKSYVLSREELLSIVDLDELDLDEGHELSKTVLLLSRPTPEFLASHTAQDVLTKYWRLMFHSRVHLVLERRLRGGKLKPSTIEQRIEQLGRCEFDEMVEVLRQEAYLLSPYNQASTYIELVAVYWELRYFCPGFVKAYFPGIQNTEQTDAILRQDLDVARLFRSTRLPGAHLSVTAKPMTKRPQRTRENDFVGASRPRAKRLCRRLAAKAQRARARGNLVRAAILSMQAARLTAAAKAGLQEDARNDLVQLAQRLRGALEFSEADAALWASLLYALLEQSSQGIWTREVRILYDLQKVCIDQQRGIYALNLWAWARTLGKEPIKRLLPGRRVIAIAQHLRSAARRLSAGTSFKDSARLLSLVKAAAQGANTNIRNWFRGSIDLALDNVGLIPTNVPERVARQKLVDELLDRIVERGFLSMGDLRDALSRNNLKLPDFDGPRQLLWGDQLIQADKQLAVLLDGVYRRGEFYLRWSQGFSALAFGTPTGRFLTRYIALPFGGAFVATEGLKHLVNATVGAIWERDIQIPTLSVTLALGVFLLGLLYYPRLRQRCLEVARQSKLLLKHLFIDLPTWLLQLTPLRAMIHSVYFRIGCRYLLVPLLVSGVIAWLFPLLTSRRQSPAGMLVTFSAVCLLFNSRFGRNVDEWLTDGLVSTWHRIRIRYIAAFLRLIMDSFDRALEAMERLLYSIDEWLRFRSGENAISTAAKLALGVIWMVVSYVIRIFVNLLIEPQINPIKHFPVVTVSHKVLLSLAYPIRSVMESSLGPSLGNTVCGFVLFLLPGVFGFLVWELKENWRLYAANSPRYLEPVIVGHHGEHVLQWLKWGFRSGTLPKAFARLRKALRKAYWTGNQKAVHKHQASILGVEEHARHFADRELLALLEETGNFGDSELSIREIHLGCNRILIELYSPRWKDESVWLAFQDQAGTLAAGIYREGWLPRLSPTQRENLADALAGFFKLAGVESILEPPGFAREVQGIVVDNAVPMTEQNPELLVWEFSTQPISWDDWVATWSPSSGIAAEATVQEAWLIPSSSRHATATEEKV